MRSIRQPDSVTAARSITDTRVYDRKDVDVVGVATPNHWHALATIWACQAGKDVYVEKPGSHNIFEGRKMVEAAHKYNRVVQHGVQLRSSEAVREAVELMRGGLIDREASAAAPHVVALAFGPYDLAAELGAAADAVGEDRFARPAAAALEPAGHVAHVGAEQQVCQAPAAPASHHKCTSRCCASRQYAVSSPIGFWQWWHTVATMLQDSGLSLRVAQSQMGHATERTTHRIYSHSNDEAMKRVAHAMEGIFGDVETGPLTASEDV